jgi:hypothetical protein
MQETCKAENLNVPEVMQVECNFAATCMATTIAPETSKVEHLDASEEVPKGMQPCGNMHGNHYCTRDLQC